MEYFYLFLHLLGFFVGLLGIDSLPVCLNEQLGSFALGVNCLAADSVHFVQKLSLRGDFPEDFLQVMGETPQKLLLLLFVAKDALHLGETRLDLLVNPLSTLQVDVRGH